MATDPPKTVAPGTVTDFLKRLARAPPRPLAPPPALQPGQVLGRYEVVREIGRGGFGTVYEARDRELPRSVALKVLHGPPDATMADERLLREAEAAAQLSHPNIVTFHDLGSSDGLTYLVLELLSGRTLGDQLQQGGLALPRALAIAGDIARGLAHAHRRGVVHRDLTPSNVFLCDDGAVKILDFGMAHGFGRRKLEGGTRPYMAPEQRRGAPEDERTDVFALGVILYQMLSGALPFPDAASLQARAEAARLRVEGRPEIGHLLGRMLAKDPVARPRSGEEVAAALGTLDRGHAVLRGEGGRIRLQRSRRLPTTVWAATGALAVLGLWWWQGSSGPATAQAGPRSTGAVPAPETVPVQAPAPSPRPPTSDGPPERHADRKRPVSRPAATCRESIGSYPTPPSPSGQGILTIEADPFGDVYVDGRPQGEAPRECLVAAGTHRVRVIHARLGTLEAEVRVGPGERNRWLARFGSSP